MNKLPQRESYRLKGYDYAKNGCYFVTLCTKQRENILGQIINGIMVSNKYGEIINKEITETNKLRSNIDINIFVIMPNHIHMIIEIINVGTKISAGYHSLLRSPSQTLGAVVRGIKSSTSNKIGFSIWQKSYYDHIIRTQKEYEKICQYIIENPLRFKNKLI